MLTFGQRSKERMKGRAAHGEKENGIELWNGGEGTKWTVFTFRLNPTISIRV